MCGVTTFITNNNVAFVRTLVCGQPPLIDTNLFTYVTDELRFVQTHRILVTHQCIFLIEFVGTSNTFVSGFRFFSFSLFLLLGCAVTCVLQNVSLKHTNFFALETGEDFLYVLFVVLGFEVVV
jgi:hypothetical protein